MAECHLGVAVGVNGGASVRGCWWKVHECCNHVVVLKCVGGWVYLVMGCLPNAYGVVNGNGQCRDNKNAPWTTSSNC